LEAGNRLSISDWIKENRSFLESEVGWSRKRKRPRKKQVKRNTEKSRN
jgi:hypothetical protein